VTEAIGFSDGNDPSKDIMVSGMLGILTTMNLIERLDKVQ
jgi:hypothetical protein